MFYLLLLATVSVSLAADAKLTDAKKAGELNAAESMIPIRVHESERGYRFEDGLEVMRHREHIHRPHHNHEHHDHEHRRHEERHADRIYIETKDPSGPVIYRTNPHRDVKHEHINIEKQNKVISHVYSPDFYQPTWVLDYRYLKKDGRDYTRGPGGQILILPKGIHTNEKKEFADFDALLEHLRLTRLSEEQARQKERHEQEHRYREEKEREEKRREEEQRQERRKEEERRYEIRREQERLDEIRRAQEHRRERLHHDEHAQRIHVPINSYYGKGHH